MGHLWHTEQDWDYYTVPQPAAANRRLHLPRGKVVGGSGQLNAMIWVRGAPQDYDGWAAAGCDGWAWADVEPVFERIERCDGPPTPGRGTDGLMDVSVTQPLHPVQQSIIDAAQQVGLPFNADYNTGALDGVSIEQANIVAGRRESTWSQYVVPVLDSPRLTVITGALVHQVTFQAGRATGVSYVKGGRLHRATAQRVVLAAGALDSPRVLLRSGIGPAEELTGLGIDVVTPLPGVGANLHDHLLSAVIFATQRDVAPPRGGMCPTQVHHFWRSRPGLDRPDTQPLHFSVPMYQPWMEGPAHGFSLMAGLVTPESRGSVRLSGTDPQAEPLIDLGALTARVDLEALKASVAQCRAIGQAAALAGGWGAVELYPGPGVVTDAELEAYVRRSAVTYHHQVGTCAMGTGDQSVVSPRLAVHGVDHLYVADASIMPTVTTGNTNAPAVMIGERAAGFLLDGLAAA
jgi:choline dehydrogenase-like flavoprotein